MQCQLSLIYQVHPSETQTIDLFAQGKSQLPPVEQTIGSRFLASLPELVQIARRDLSGSLAQGGRARVSGSPPPPCGWQDSEVAVQVILLRSLPGQYSSCSVPCSLYGTVFLSSLQFWAFLAVQSCFSLSQSVRPRGQGQGQCDMALRGLPGT